MVYALIVAALVACGLYSLTFTPHGRMKFLPALICKVAGLQMRFGPGVTYSPADREAANRSVRQMMRLPEPAGVTVEDYELALPDRRLPLRSYRPLADGPLPLLLNIHGGAWWMGNDFIDDSIMRHLCAEAGVVIVSVDYRLAPEHVYPAALEDCYAALQWVADNAALLGGDADRLGVYGTSAGGGLAAALCSLTRRRGGPALMCQILIVPVTDLTGEHSQPSLRELGTGYILTEADLGDMIDNYLPDEQMRREPLASPVFDTDAAGLPPAFLATAEFDPLRDMGEAYGDLLSAAGVSVEKIRYPGVIHGFFGSKDVLLQCNLDAAATIRQYLHA
ncbi:MAG: alpha/beta hydrolase [Pseudomonadota bacterium]